MKVLTTLALGLVELALVYVALALFLVTVSVDLASLGAVSAYVVIVLIVPLYLANHWGEQPTDHWMRARRFCLLSVFAHGFFAPFGMLVLAA